MNLEKRGKQVIRSVSFFLILISILCCLFLFIQLPVIFAQEVHFDPVNGNNRNPGLSSATAKKGNTEVSISEENSLLNPNKFEIPDVPLKLTGEPKNYSLCAEFELQRIILGAEIITGWEIFSNNIWRSNVRLAQNQSVESVLVDGETLYPGCSPDFLGEGQYYYQPETLMLYINIPEGNPDVSGKKIILQLFDFQADEVTELNITGWANVPPVVWQAELLNNPVNIFVDDLLIEEDAWWGPQYCEIETGASNTLYLRDGDGNPDVNNKTVVTAIHTGGWTVASGDFNGDGLFDVVHSNAMQQENGQIFINYGSSEFSSSPERILSDPAETAGFGYYVTSAGDVNGDGFDELLVANDWESGVVFIYMGSANGLSEKPEQQLSVPEGLSGFGFGHGIAGNGDINGDDHSDILIAGGDDSQSYLCVYLGTEDGIPQTPDSVVVFPDKIYGGSVCIAGDLNGDGFDEIALSLGMLPPTEQIELMVFYGSAGGVLADPHLIGLNIPLKESLVNAEVTSAGDINSDGFADLLVGNQWAQGDFENEGKAYIYLGSNSGLADIPNVTIDNPLPGFNVRFGSSLSSLGDFNSDGYEDIAIGCPYHLEDNGFLTIYKGSSEGLANVPENIIEGVNQFGWSVAQAGDLNGDGQISLIAGEEFGGAYLYTGSNPITSMPGCGASAPGCDEK